MKEDVSKMSMDQIMQKMKDNGKQLSEAASIPTKAEEAIDMVCMGIKQDILLQIIKTEEIIRPCTIMKQASIAIDKIHPHWEECDCERSSKKAH